MKVVVIGSGYVGLVTAACLAQLGFSVVTVDKDDKKIAALQRGEIPIYEDGLTEIVETQGRAGKLAFASSLDPHASEADIAIIAVGTPSLPDGQLDLSAVEGVAAQLAAKLGREATIVVKSTVPAGTCARLENLVAGLRGSADLKVVSNPEFLREGTAVKDFFGPDRIVIGSSDAQAGKKVTSLYGKFAAEGIPFVITDQTTSELIKYAANGFLAMKITFINELAHLCATLNSDVNDLARGIGLDPRIGTAFLKPGPGYGGSCFPKDILALSALGQEANSPVRLIESVAAANAFHVRRLFGQATLFFSRCWGLPEARNSNLVGRKIAVLGLAFKAKTDDVRDSASLTLCRQLMREGVKVAAFDPAATASAKKVIPLLDVQPSLEAALSGADGVIIMTEWAEFAGFDWSGKGKTLLKTLAIADFRNLLDPSTLRTSGYKLLNLGRK